MPVVPAPSIYLVLVSPTAAAWMYAQAWPASGENFLPVLLTGTLVALVGGGFSTLPARQVGIIAVAAPAVLAAFTASRGDEDGLWVLGYIFFIGLAFLFALLSKFGRRFSSGKANRASATIGWILGLATASLTLVVVVSEWPRPHSEVSAALQRIDLRGFKVLSENASGKALSTAQPPQVTWLLAGAGPSRRDCGVLLQRLRQVASVTKSGEDCTIVGNFAGRDLGKWIEISVTPWRSELPQPRFYLTGVLNLRSDES